MQIYNYIDFPYCAQNFYLGNLIDSHPEYFMTGPFKLRLMTENNTIDVFPGQRIIFLVTVLDRLGHNTTLCNAIPTLQCNHNDYPSLSCNTGNNTTVKLNGERQLLLKSMEYFESGLYFTSTHISEPLKDFAIKFTCMKTFIQANLHVTLTMCPLGYTFDSNMMTYLNSSGVCKCVKDTNLQCSDNLGIVCVRNGFWYGTMKGDNKLLNITIQCNPPYCANRESCPLNEFSDTFMKLPTTQDDQCSGLHGGVMCRGCQKEAIFTF